MKPKLKFFDFKSRKSFETDDYDVTVKNGRKWAISKDNPSKTESWRALPKDFEC